MTEEAPQYKQIGQHIILHDRLDAALSEIVTKSQISSSVYPNFNALYSLVGAELDIQGEESENNPTVKKFREEWDSCNRSFGNFSWDRQMTRNEAGERLMVVQRAMRRMRLTKMAERESEWRDIALEVEAKEAKR